jgi:hypothetical protein
MITLSSMGYTSGAGSSIGREGRGVGSSDGGEKGGNGNMGGRNSSGEVTNSYSSCDQGNISSSGSLLHDPLEELLQVLKSSESRWPWIATLAAIFQRASLQDRLKFLEQRQGTLLLQLLYQVLLEDRGLGGQGIGVGAEGAAVLSVSKAGVDVGECLAAIPGTGVRSVVNQLGKNDQMIEMEVHILVLLVLQCLLYKPLRADRETLEVLQPSKLVLLDCGKSWCCKVPKRARQLATEKR